MLLKTYFLSSLIIFLAGSFLSGTWSTSHEALRILLLQAGLIMVSVSAYKYLRSLPGVIFGVIGCLCIVQILYHQIAWVSVPVYFGLFAGVVLFIKTQSHILFKRWGEAFLPAVVAACTVLMGSHYYDFALKERFEGLGFHQDTLFHAAITTMLKTYNVSSTGLNGLEPIDYHILVHRITAAFSILTEIPVWVSFPLVNLLIIGPGLVCALAFCIMKISSNKITIQASMLLAGVLLSIDKLLNLKSVANWDHIFCSESYGLAIGLFLIGLPFFFTESKKFERVGAGLLMGAACFSKISLIPFCFAAILCGQWNQLNKNIRLVLVPTVLVGILYLLKSKMLSLQFEPFYYATAHNKIWNQEFTTFLKRPFSGTLAETLKALWSLGLFLVGNIFPLVTCLLYSWKKNQEQKWFFILNLFLFLSFLQVKVAGVFYLYNPAYILALPFFGIYLANKWANQKTTQLGLFLLCLINTCLNTSSNLYKKTEFKPGLKEKEVSVVFFSEIKNATKDPNGSFFTANVSDDLRKKVDHYNTEARYLFYFPVIKEKAFIKLLPNQKPPNLKYYGYDEYYNQNGKLKINY
jgi:hypothetical protein